MSILKYTADYSVNKTLIVLTRKGESLEPLKQWVDENTLTIIESASQNGVSNLILPQANRLLIVEFLVSKPKEAHTKEAARKAGAQRIQNLKHYKVKEALLVQTGAIQEGLEYALGLALANYSFTKYLSNPDKAKTGFESLLVHSSVGDEAAVVVQNNVVDAVYRTRTWVNEPLSFLTAVQMSKEIEAFAEELGDLDVKILHKPEIEALNMGGLLGVNKGSIDPPTFNIMEWKPEGAKNTKPIVLVGKGVVYDTGGLSLKPTAMSMDFMKCDMGGAAVVLGSMYLIAKNKLPLHVIGLVPATDNRPGGNAITPGDILHMSSGATVEVMNTDAEGRLILADALHYAKQYDPELVLDFATLTGATARALGPLCAGYMGNASREVMDALDVSAWNTYERLVEFPLWEEFGEMLKSDIADIKNLGSGGAGGITAGKFLEFFTDYPWVHFDIAGTAFMHKEDNYKVKGGTGYGVRLVYDFLSTYYL